MQRTASGVGVMLSCAAAQSVGVVQLIAQKSANLFVSPQPLPRARPRKFKGEPQPTDAQKPTAHDPEVA